MTRVSAYLPARWPRRRRCRHLGSVALACPTAGDLHNGAPMMSVRVLVGDEGKPPSGYARSWADHVDSVAIPGLVALIRPDWPTEDVVRVSSALSTMVTGWQDGEQTDATVSGVTISVVPMVA